MSRSSITAGFLGFIFFLVSLILRLTRVKWYNNHGKILNIERRLGVKGTDHYFIIVFGIGMLLSLLFASGIFW
jgi:hypothetical protein